MKVSFEDHKPGMVLTAALVDDGGRLLRPTGIALTEDLRFFQMWGIAEADIEGDERAERDPDAIDPARLAAAAVEPPPSRAASCCTPSPPARA